MFPALWLKWSLDARFGALRLGCLPLEVFARLLSLLFWLGSRKLQGLPPLPLLVLHVQRSPHSQVRDCVRSVERLVAQISEAS